MDSSGNHEGRLDHPPAGDETTLDSLLEHQRAWETFAAEAIHMIPVLKAQMTSVTQETERAAMELLLHLRLLASSEGVATPKTESTSLSKVVMAMQFQDITRQKLEHVGQALEQLKSHLLALLKGPLSEEAKKEIAALEGVEQNYTMEEERRLHQSARNQDYGEPVPMGLSDEGADSVTLF
jgi:chemotaxis regulatin CheY-phosphate phosphatase CheZ